MNETNLDEGQKKNRTANLLIVTDFSGKCNQENESEDNLKNEMEYIKRNERKFWAFQMS